MKIFNLKRINNPRDYLNYIGDGYTVFIEETGNLYLYNIFQIKKNNIYCQTHKLDTDIRSEFFFNPDEFDLEEAVPISIYINYPFVDYPGRVFVFSKDDALLIKTFGLHGKLREELLKLVEKN